MRWPARCIAPKKKPHIQPWGRSRFGAKTSENQITNIPLPYAPQTRSKSREWNEIRFPSRSLPRALLLLCQKARSIGVWDDVFPRFCTKSTEKGQNKKNRLGKNGNEGEDTTFRAPNSWTEWRFPVGAVFCFSTAGSCFNFNCFHLFPFDQLFRF